MKIGIDISVLGNKFYGGIENYTFRIVENLLQIDTENEYFFFSSRALKDKARKLIEGHSFSQATSENRIKWSFWRLPSMIESNNLDVFVSPTHMGPQRIPGKTKYVVVIHDLIYKTHKQRYPLKERALCNFGLWRSLSQADQVIAVSEATKKDLLELTSFPDKRIAVVHHGYDNNLFRVNENGLGRKIKERFSIRDKYLLSVGSIYQRKNLETLIKAYSELPAALQSVYQLVLVGRVGEEEYFASLKELVSKKKLKKRVVFTGLVSNQELASFYQGASIFVLPSVAEGFGLPLLEAMACGVLVLTTDFPAAKEVLGDYGIKIKNPLDVREMSGKLERLLEDQELTQTLRQGGLEHVKMFDWQKAAEKTLKIISENS